MSEGRGFLLQGGDCAEAFAEHHPDGIRDFFRVFLQMAVVLTFGVGLLGDQGGPHRRPVRQAALLGDGDPRRRGAAVLPGDIVNDIAFTSESRMPDPHRMEMAYRQSAATLNLLRAFAQGGYANLDNVHSWMLGFVEDSPQGHRYRALADRISELLEFMRACGVSAESTPQLQSTDLYTSHEALLLGYEQAFTRIDSLTGEPTTPRPAT